MITENTVFVVGAGASRSYGFPAGEELLQQLRNGNSLIVSSRWDNDDDLREPVDPARRRFEDALGKAQLPSIDEFLQEWSEHLPIGKQRIAEVLLPCELPEVSLHDKEDDWLSELWHEMRSKPDDFAKNKVTVISYNYDRLEPIRKPV